MKDILLSIICHVSVMALAILLIISLFFLITQLIQRILILSNS